MATGRPRKGARKHTLEEYLSLFTAARPDQLVGEGSPQYLRSAVAASGIAQAQPAARIIAILREPVSFLRSFHLQMLSSNVEEETDFGKALALERERREGRRVPRHCRDPAVLMYSEHVRYVEQLRRYEALFSRENMLVLIYDDYRTDNGQRFGGAAVPRGRRDSSRSSRSTPSRGRPSATGRCTGSRGRRDAPGATR